MVTNLAAIKVYVPRLRASLVPRRDLVERLKTGLVCPLTLVSAPASYGKTTLLSEWARQMPTGNRVAWISLEAAESDPIRFWDYFIAAVGPSWRRGGRPAAASFTPAATN